MASAEGKSYQNPIRLYTVERGRTVYSENKSQKSFGNQIPGSYIQDIENIYICTHYKTEKGERVWERVDGTTLKGSKQYFIFVNSGKNGTEPYTVDSNGKKIVYKTTTLRARNMGTIKLTYPQRYGTYIFVGLSSADIDKIKGEPASTAAGVGGSSYSTDMLTSTVAEAHLLGLNEMYESMRVNSNGKTGMGTTTGSAKIKTSPDYVPNWRGGIELTGKNALKPSPSGKTNPSSQSSNSSSSQKKPGTSPKSSNAPGTTTVKVSFLPEKLVNSGVSFNNDKPYIEQEIIHFSKQRDSQGVMKDCRQKITRRHVFDIVPNTFEISQLSSTWNEVERSGNYPMVDWSKYNLTKCSFRFLVSGNRVEVAKIGSGDASVTTVLNDGLDIPVDSEIENIRIMAGTPAPVKLYNLNTLLSTSFRYPYLENTRGIQWVIADMSVNVTRMTPNGRAIAVAEVSITLNEFPLIARQIVELPPLNPYDPKKKQCKKGKCPPPAITGYGLFTDTYTFGLPDTVSYPPATPGV